MVKQIVNIVEFQTLYNILSEVSDLVSFDILNFESINDFLINIDNNENKNLTIILKSLNKDLFKCKNIEKKNIIIIDKFPITLEKLIDKINIQLIKQKYDFQSKLTLKNYLVNLNSRIISKNKTELKLTEKEVDILVFFKENKNPQSIINLQNKVWQYSVGLETHTVETHIYRLRKKIKDTFNDENFILSNDDGYSI
jgi:DNA-binding response OmpR family regulator